MSRRITPANASTEPHAFTLSEFCVAHRIGLNSYYRLRKAGKGPDEFHVGSKVLVSKESAARWRAARDAEAKKDSEAKKAKKDSEDSDQN
jgi:hypothetical protein